MIGRRVFFAIFLYIVFNLIFVTPAKAFLAASGITIIASSLLPHLLFILINALLTILAVIKKNKIIFVVLIIIMIIGAAYSIKEYTKIRSVNTSPVIVTNTEGDDWDVFRKKIQERISDRNYGSMKVFQFGIQRLEVRDYDPGNYSVVIGTTRSDGFHLENTKIDIDDIMFRVINNAFDKDALEEFMGEMGVRKTDRILIYCPGGTTSSFTTYILDHYGYNVHYLPLKNAASLSLDKNSPSFNDEQFVIQNVDIADTEIHPYVFFMLTINDYFHWKSTVCEDKSLPGGLTLLKASKDLEENDSFYCGSNPLIRTPVSKIDIPFYLGENHIFEKNTKILCLDRWQCFLTKHFLYEHQLNKQFNTLYCLFCEDN